VSRVFVCVCSPYLCQKFANRSPKPSISCRFRPHLSISFWFSVLDSFVHFSHIRSLLSFGTTLVFLSAANDKAKALSRSLVSIPTLTTGSPYSATNAPHHLLRVGNLCSVSLEVLSLLPDLESLLIHLLTYLHCFWLHFEPCRLFQLGLIYLDHLLNECLDFPPLSALPPPASFAHGFT